MPDTIKLIDGLGNAVEIPVTRGTREKPEEWDDSDKIIDSRDRSSNVPGAFGAKEDLIISIRVAAMHIYNRADKYVDELTDPENMFISIDFDEHGIPSVNINKTEHVTTPNHVENSLDIKQMWREENADNR